MSKIVSSNSREDRWNTIGIRDARVLQFKTLRVVELYSGFQGLSRFGPHLLYATMLSSDFTEKDLKTTSMNYKSHFSVLRACFEFSFFSLYIQQGSFTSPRQQPIPSFISRGRSIFLKFCSSFCKASAIGYCAPVSGVSITSSAKTSLTEASLYTPSA